MFNLNIFKIDFKANVNYIQDDKGMLAVQKTDYFNLVMTSSDLDNTLSVIRQAFSTWANNYNDRESLDICIRVENNDGDITKSIKDIFESVSKIEAINTVLNYSPSRVLD